MKLVIEDIDMSDNPMFDTDPKCDYVALTRCDDSRRGAERVSGPRLTVVMQEPTHQFFTEFAKHAEGSNESVLLHHLGGMRVGAYFVRRRET